MKKVFIFGASALLLAGCQTYSTVGTGEYGYTYDLPLSPVSGTQAELDAALRSAPSSYATVAPAPTGQVAPAQSVVFYEGAQPAQGAVAATTPVWTAPAPVAAAPAVVPGVTANPQINEPAGAAVGAGGAVAPNGVVGGGFIGGGGFVGGDVAIPGTNGNGGISLQNSNNISISNGIVTTNFVNTNVVSTNANTNLNNTNIASTNLLSTNVVTTTNGTGTSLAGATNNLNTLPRASGPTAGTPPGTQLVPNRPIGEPAGAQISPSPSVPAGSITPTTPTQPGPQTSTSTQQGSTTGAQMTTQTTVTGAQVPTAPQVNPQQRVLQNQTTPQGAQTSPQTGAQPAQAPQRRTAPAPATAPK